MGRRPSSFSATSESTAEPGSIPFEEQPPTFMPNIDLNALPTVSTPLVSDVDEDMESGLDDDDLPLDELTMMSNQFDSYNNYETDDGEEAEDTDLDAELELLKGGDNEESEVDGQEDEGAEDKEVEESDSDTESTKEEESALDPRVAAQLDALAKQTAAVEARMKELAEATAKAEAERLRATKEAELITERGRQIEVIRERLRGEYDSLEDVDPRAFNALVAAELRDWETKARVEIDTELRKAEMERLEAATQEAKLAARDAEIETFLAALPKGTQLLGHKTTQTEGTWGQLVADVYRLGADNGAITASFPEFAKAMAAELQGVFESGRKIGQSDAAKKLAKGASAPPPVTNRGGTGKTETRPEPKGIFSPEGMRDFFAGKKDISLFSEITTPSRRRR